MVSGLDQPPAAGEKVDVHLQEIVIRASTGDSSRSRLMQPPRPEGRHKLVLAAGKAERRLVVVHFQNPELNKGHREIEYGGGACAARLIDELIDVGQRLDRPLRDGDEAAVILAASLRPFRHRAKAAKAARYCCSHGTHLRPRHIAGIAAGSAVTYAAAAPLLVGLAVAAQ